MSKEPLFVTCPVCGKVNQKSLFTYSEVRCQRCHRELTAFADLGVVVGIDMNKKRSKEEVDRLVVTASRPQPKELNNTCKSQNN